MSKIIYLNSHLRKFREEKPIEINIEDIDDLFSRVNQFGMSKEVEKILIKSFKDKKDFKIVQKFIEPLTDKVLLYSLITLYWSLYIVYYNREGYADKIADCLEVIDEKVVLLDSPRYCKKVYFYLNSPDLVNQNKVI